ncbi:MAG TPA: YciI family protein [Solirubrobacterales bacterium]|nr:YciI family protein [Solirubrobacterales bacterium]
MRFMMLMYPGIDTSAENWEPSADDVAAMTAYNEELSKAGVLLALDGLRSPADGARVSFSGGTPTATDGPFAEAKEVVGGYWLIQASSKQEAVEWALRCPAGEDDFIEVRRVFEMEDFSEDVQAAGQLSERPPEQT